MLGLENGRLFWVPMMYLVKRKRNERGEKRQGGGCAVESSARVNLAA
jgi:hypothetical protein